MKEKRRTEPVENEERLPEASPIPQLDESAGGEPAGLTPVADTQPSAAESAPAGPGVAELEQQVKTLEDKYLRVLAEFDNYKRRTSREHERLVESANAGIMQDLVGVREDMERALKAGQDSADAGALREGVRLIYTRFDGILSRHGLEPFAVEGDVFDPVYHDAMLRMPHATIAEDHVAQVLERGYRLNGQVIKHARVIVSAGPAASPAVEAGAESPPENEAQTEGEQNG